MNKLAIGIVTHNETTAKYLPYFLKSLEEQNFQNFKVFVLDNSNSEDNHNRKYLDKYSDFNYQWSEENLGFARAYNLLIAKAVRARSKYFLALNPDTILEGEAIRKMIEAMEEDEELGSVSPKIYRWDFDNNKKLNIIDTCGLVSIAPLRFVDLGQGKIDIGQFNDKQIIGPSGAAAMYRLDALERAEDSHGYFDDRMFMYKEDCDIAYRLKNAGYKSKLISDSIVFHDRTAQAGGRYIWDIIKNRKNKSKKINLWSFRNQQIIFSKHWHSLNFLEKTNVLLYQFRLFTYAFFFEPYLLKDYFAEKKIR